MGCHCSLRCMLTLRCIDANCQYSHVCWRQTERLLCVEWSSVSILSPRFDLGALLCLGHICHREIYLFHHCYHWMCRYYTAVRYVHRSTGRRSCFHFLGALYLTEGSMSRAKSIQKPAYHSIDLKILSKCMPKISISDNSFDLV